MSGGGSAAEAPIGVFDSGIGGLTVLRALRRRLPAERTIYLGDTARVPYGPKSPETVRRYAREAADFLIGRGVKLLVVACNTATARALPRLAAELAVPVVGVIEPGARAAVRATRGGAIGVIGTAGTVASGAYEAAIHDLRPDVRVEAAACPLFVALVEEGWTEGPVARLTAERYLDPLLGRGIDTLVLGCTHYPLLRPLLDEVAGPGVELVDSAEATAAAVEEELERRGLAAPVGGEAGSASYHVTDDAARFGRIAERWLGRAPDRLERVELGARPACGS